MGKKSGQPADLFMNFKAVDGSTGADSDALQEFEVPTGLSIRGALIWLIHMIEVYYDGPFTSGFLGLTIALSTRKGLVAMPEVNDDGCLAVFHQRILIAGASGMAGWVWPMVSHFLPPVPLASPSVSLYVQGTADHADGRDNPVRCRIGFTTAPLDAAAYTEIAEGWGW